MNRAPLPVLLVLWLLATALPAQVSTRTNGLYLTEALPELRQTILNSAAQLLNEKGKPCMAATLISTDGYFLTKSSEIPPLSEITLRLSNDQTVKVREVWRDRSRDLLLAQGLDLSVGPVLKMLPEADIPPATWLCAIHGIEREVRLGVNSAQRRKIPSQGAALGIRMAPESGKPTSEAHGVRITGIAADSPAATAGLRKNDLLLEIEGQPMRKFDHVREIVSKRQPGDELHVTFRRNGQDSQVNVLLASRTKIIANWDGEDYANGGISLRTDGFPDIIQHDLPLDPTDMGGPLFDLSGNLLAINISRVDRVTTFALPLENFWKEIRQKIIQDRNRNTKVED